MRQRQLPVLLIVLSFAAAQIPPANGPAASAEIVAVKQQMLALRSAELHYDASLGSYLQREHHLYVKTAAESALCAYLSLVALVGLGVNAIWHVTWADPVAALMIVPLIVREGWEAMRGKACGCC